MVDALRATAEALAALVDEDIDGNYLGDELITLYALIDQLHAQASRRLAVFDARGDAHGDGFKSTASWLAARCRMQSGAAARAVRVARLERALPEITDAWEAGETTAAYVEHLARVRWRAKADQHFDALADAWLRLCRESTIDDLDKALTTFLDRLDDTKPVDDQDKTDVLARRMFAGSRCLGVGNVEGRFDTEGYDTIMKAIERERDAGHAEGDERTVDQERADALVEICRRTLTGANEGGDTEPHIGVVTTQRTLDGLEAGLCETDSGLAMSRETVRRMCCHSVVTRILIDQLGAVIDVGRGERIFTRAQRRAMAYRDRGCCFPGCRRPVRHCQTHHLTWWEHGGTTDLNNGALLCHVHHRLVHEQRWHVVRNASGGLDWYKPDRSYHATWHPPSLPPPLPMDRAA